jgi:hypothetical protein
MKNILLLIFLFISLTAYSQVSLNTLGTPPVATAMLDVSSTSRGILIPRMTTGDRDAILAPASSLMIFNISTNAYNYWNGTAWIAIAAGKIKELSDADADTKVEVEKNADEDKIRFTIAGNEIGILDAKCFQLKSPGHSVFIGESSGANDDGTNNDNVFVGYHSGTVQHHRQWKYFSWKQCR